MSFVTDVIGVVAIIGFFTCVKMVVMESWKLYKESEACDAEDKSFAGFVNWVVDFKVWRIWF
jgi:hypothetical protein